MQTLWSAHELCALPRAGIRYLQLEIPPGQLWGVQPFLHVSDTSLLPAAAAALGALGLCRKGGTPSHQADPTRNPVIPVLWSGLVIFLRLSDMVGSHTHGLRDFLLCDPRVQSNFLECSEFSKCSATFPAGGTGTSKGSGYQCGCASSQSAGGEILVCAVGLSLEPVAEKKMHLFSSKHPMCIQMHINSNFKWKQLCEPVAGAGTWHLLQGVNNTNKRKRSHEVCLIWPQRLGLFLWKWMLMRELFNKPPLFYCIKCVTAGAFSFCLSKLIPCRMSVLYIPVGES